MCVVIGLLTSPSSQGPATRQCLHLSQSNATVPPEILPRFPIQRPAQQDNCSAFAWHLFTHVRNREQPVLLESRSGHMVLLPHQGWDTTVCISLVKSAGTKSCHLCGAEHMILGQSLTNVHRRTKILNLKSKMRGNCSCKTRFLRFLQSDQERGALMRVRYAPKQSSSLTGGTGWESYFTFHQYCTSNTTPLLFEWASFGRVFRERGGQKKVVWVRVHTPAGNG